MTKMLIYFYFDAPNLLEMWYDKGTMWVRIER